MPVLLTVGQARCTCPGAERLRAWTEDPRALLEYHKASKQVFHPVRRAARGKSRDEVRDLYIAELRKRGQEVPPELFLEAHLDFLTGQEVRGFRKVWKVARDLFPHP
jgi:hypothetical protein